MHINKRLFYLVLLLTTIGFLSFIFFLFISHTIYMGTDELRITYAAKEIAQREKIYFTDKNNDIYKTTIFVKNGFLINKEKNIYPYGFTLNSLILVPFLSFTPDPILAFNIFAFTCYIASFAIVYQIFIKLSLSQLNSLIGAATFSITNYNLAMYVSYYPDFLLTFFVLVFIYLIILFDKEKQKTYLYMLTLVSAFLLAYKVTIYPILITFFPLYFFYLYKKVRISRSSLVKIGIILGIFWVLYNGPQIATSTMGSTYNDLNTDTITTVDTTTLQKNNSIISKAEHLGNKFFVDFLLPKNQGKYLIWHILGDFTFFGLNNMIVLFGFLIAMVYMTRTNKSLFIISLLLFLTSFLLWGNMNFYGGKSPDLTNLRNTHTRYLLPLITLFYIIGYVYIVKHLQAKFLPTLLFLLIFIRTSISLQSEYPFYQYSLINRTGYVYDYANEKKDILNLNLPDSSLFISAAFDDYDLGYYFVNYANIKLLASNNDTMRTTIARIVNNAPGPVYFLFPKIDSSFNPLNSAQLAMLHDYISTQFTNKIIFADKYKEVIFLHRKEPI